MNIIRNINLDDLIEMLTSIRASTNIVDMEVDEQEKTIVFIPKTKEQDIVASSDKVEDDITSQIKKMKDEFNNNKDSTNIPISRPPKLDLSDLNKLI